MVLRAGSFKQWILVSEDSGELLRAPLWMTLADLDDRLDQAIGRLCRARQRTARTLLQARRPFVPMTMDPLVARSATDVVVRAQIRERLHASQDVCDKQSSFVHRTGLVPGHTAPP